MLTSIQRARVTVVLVRARNPGNIGAAARAMHDFGFPDLRLVNPYPVPMEAARSAVDASEVLHAADSHPTLGEALRDCTLVLGTTAVGERDLQHPLDSMAAAGGRIAEFLDAPEDTPEDTPAEALPRVALLFGSEKTGLSNDELSYCHRLVTIPMHPHPGLRHPSMNLGQAVAVCLYELVRDRPLPPRGPEEPSPSATDGVPSIEIERIRDLLSEVLESSGYRRHHPANSDAAAVRRLLLRLALRRTDAPVLLGILRQILWKLQQPGS